MRLFGLEISRTKSAVPVTDLSAFNRGWFPIIHEPFMGAWQRNREVRQETIHTYHAVYACATLIASDVAKCRIKLVEQDGNGIWDEVDAAAFSPVLRKPNRYQNRIKFFEQWVISKLMHGNAYILKERDNRGIVTDLYVLDPYRVKPLIAENGEVYYQLAKDKLSGIEDAETVPASEIIHDVMVPLFHPLCGVSPLVASALASMQGMSIQRNAERFFSNGSNPGGVLTAPGTIDDVTANRLKEEWQTRFSGENSGKVAVLGDGLSYQAMTMTAVDSQLLEQLQWTAKIVCSCFHVPAYKVGLADPPAYNNIEALDQQYYSQCLQKLFECIELCLDEGLGLDTVKGHLYGTEFDLDGLLRMDTATLIESEAKAVGAGFKAPNEARKRVNLRPVKGGESPMIQQQNFSLAALAKRDAKDDPFAGKAPTPPQQNDNVQPPAGKFMSALTVQGKFAGAYEKRAA